LVELMPMLKERTLLITVAPLDEKLKVNVIPAKAKEGEDPGALTTPLSYTGSPRRYDLTIRFFNVYHSIASDAQGLQVGAVESFTAH